MLVRPLDSMTKIVQLPNYRIFTRALEFRFGPPTHANRQAKLFNLHRHKLSGNIWKTQWRIAELSLESLFNCFVFDLCYELAHLTSPLASQSLWKTNLKTKRQKLATLIII